jgi:hypothetical protein
MHSVVHVNLRSNVIVDDRTLEQFRAAREDQTVKEHWISTCKLLARYMRALRLLEDGEMLGLECFKMTHILKFAEFMINLPGNLPRKESENVGRTMVHLSNAVSKSGLRPCNDLVGRPIHAACWFFVMAPEALNEEERVQIISILSNPAVRENAHQDITSSAFAMQIFFSHGIDMQHFAFLMCPAASRGMYDAAHLYLSRIRELTDIAFRSFYGERFTGACVNLFDKILKFIYEKQFAAYSPTLQIWTAVVGRSIELHAELHDFLYSVECVRFAQYLILPKIDDSDCVTKFTGNLLEIFPRQIPTLICYNMQKFLLLNFMMNCYYSCGNVRPSVDLLRRAERGFRFAQELAPEAQDRLLAEALIEFRVCMTLKCLNWHIAGDAMSYIIDIPTSIWGDPLIHDQFIEDVINYFATAFRNMVFRSSRSLFKVALRPFYAMGETDFCDEPSQAAAAYAALFGELVPYLLCGDTKRKFETEDGRRLLEGWLYFISGVLDGIFSNGSISSGDGLRLNVTETTKLLTERSWLAPVNISKMHHGSGLPQKVLKLSLKALVAIPWQEIFIQDAEHRLVLITLISSLAAAIGNEGMRVNYLPIFLLILHACSRGVADGDTFMLNLMKSTRIPPLHYKECYDKVAPFFNTTAVALFSRASRAIKSFGSEVAIRPGYMPSESTLMHSIGQLVGAASSAEKDLGELQRSLGQAILGINKPPAKVGFTPGAEQLQGDFCGKADESFVFDFTLPASVNAAMLRQYAAQIMLRACRLLAKIGSVPPGPDTMEGLRWIDDLPEEVKAEISAAVDAEYAETQVVAGA